MAKSIQESNAQWAIVASWLRVLTVSLTIILIVDIFVKRWLRYKEFRRKVDKLPGPPTSSSLLGNIPAKVISLLVQNSDQSSQDSEHFYSSQIQSLLGHTFIYKKEPFFRLWLGQEPVVCIWKPDMVERVLGDNFLLEKSYHYDFLKPWLGDGLLTSPGRIWKPRRKLLVPSFHFNILQAFVPVFNRKSQLMVRNIKRKFSYHLESNSNSIPKENSTVVDITPIITACTLDAICETIMGVSIDAQENNDNDYCQSIYLVGETFLERIIQPRYWIDLIFRHTELGKLYNYHLNKLHSFTRKVISEKKRCLINNKSTSAQGTESINEMKLAVSKSLSMASKVRVLDQATVDSFKAANSNAPPLPKAFLDLLLDRLDSSPNGRKLSDEEIREEVDTFMFEGHDTTAMALSWTLFLLGHYPSAQVKAQAEIDDLFREHLLEDTSNLELDHLKRLKYLDCVIKEALRLCPSVPFIGRKTTSELELGGHSIPPGCVIFVLIYQLHRNSDIFPNPEKFDPDRFLPDNTLGRHPFAYVPFSAGPRNCIGQKFAMAEMKTILLHLLKNFRFESVTPLEKARVQMEMVLRPKCALNIRIKRRDIETN